MPLDVKQLSDGELRALLGNCRRLHNTEMEHTVVQEMHERGLATSREYAAFPWNPDRVDQIMERFARIAKSVPNNERVFYTRAGGRKIGTPKDHPEHLWIDSYAAIKALDINAVFGCEIVKAGSDPKLTLYLGGGSRRQAQPSKVYNSDQLDEAFADWEHLARSAGAGEQDREVR